MSGVSQNLRLKHPRFLYARRGHILTGDSPESARQREGCDQRQGCPSRDVGREESRIVGVERAPAGQISGLTDRNLMLLT